MTKSEEADLQRYLTELGDWLEVMDRGGGVLVGSAVRGANWDQVSHGHRDQANTPVVMAASVERSLRAILQGMGQYHREVLVEKHYWGALPLRQYVSDRKELKMARETWWRQVRKAEADFMRARVEVGDLAVQAPARNVVEIDIDKPFAQPLYQAGSRASAGEAER